MENNKEELIKLTTEFNGETYFFYTTQNEIDKAKEFGKNELAIIVGKTLFKEQIS